MHKNFAKTFSLEDPARRIGMSVRNFVRRFKQATGDSPLVYLQKLPIAAAKRMLASNHRSMQQIGDAVGATRILRSSARFFKGTLESRRAIIETGSARSKMLQSEEWPQSCLHMTWDSSFLEARPYGSKTNRSGLCPCDQLPGVDEARFPCCDGVLLNFAPV